MATKSYVCRLCGKSGFISPQALGGHTGKCGKPTKPKPQKKKQKLVIAV